MYEGKGRYQYWDNIVFQITRLFMIQCLCLWHLSYFLFSCIFPILFDLPHIKCLYLLSKQSNMIVFFIMNSQLERREITFILILNFWKTKNLNIFSDFLIHCTSFEFSSIMQSYNMIEWFRYIWLIIHEFHTQIGLLYWEIRIFKPSLFYDKGFVNT